ncbi:MAG: hypothetical protein IPH12_03780 [Saprospirales bacterium]|nr:hypothetical protein [Saprospirales bacterium]
MKHNEISKLNPLHIDIFLEDGYVTVCNTILKKSVLPESTGVGLANIQARYQVLSERDVLISDTGGFFTVKIPILSV